MKMDIDPSAIFAPPILTFICVVLGYLHGRIIRRGKPLSSIQSKMLFYFAFLVLGMLYAIMLHDQLAALFHWRNAWIAVMVAWGALLVAIAWIRYRRVALPRPSAVGDGGV
jgi:glucan phosphoethanolaminetransferase (alkaline phosphatase superfamily)